ncbi:MAG: hypothetical protein MJ133_07635 [Lachnospiraceae bacterium]|nr:hypothetical protein [Lachnospiraceae bacterium]
MEFYNYKKYKYNKNKVNELVAELSCRDNNGYEANAKLYTLNNIISGLNIRVNLVGIISYNANGEMKTNRHYIAEDIKETPRKNLESVLKSGHRSYKKYIEKGLV